MVTSTPTEFNLEKELILLDKPKIPIGLRHTVLWSQTGGINRIFFNLLDRFDRVVN